jgi:hypothetical protein
MCRSLFVLLPAAALGRPHRPAAFRGIMVLLSHNIAFCTQHTPHANHTHHLHLHATRTLHAVHLTHTALTTHTYHALHNPSHTSRFAHTPHPHHTTFTHHTQPPPPPVTLPLILVHTSLGWCTVYCMPRMHFVLKQVYPILSEAATSARTELNKVIHNPIHTNTPTNTRTTTRTDTRPSLATDTHLQLYKYSIQPTYTTKTPTTSAHKYTDS